MARRLGSIARGMMGRMKTPVSRKRVTAANSPATASTGSVLPLDLRGRLGMPMNRRPQPKSRRRY